MRVVKAYWSRLVSAYAVLGLAACLIVGWMNYLVLSNSKLLTLENAEIRTQHLAALFEKHIERIFVSVEWVSEAAAHAWRTYPNQPVALQNALALIAEREPFALQVALVDHKGIFVASNVSPQGGADLSDREHIRVHMEKVPSRLYISVPLVGRVSGRQSINVTTQIAAPSGGNSGIVVVSLDPKKISDFFDQYDTRAGGVISLLRADGVLLARSANPELVGRSFFSSDPFSSISSGKHAGTYSQVSPVDGVARIVSYRALPSLPLVVLMGVSEEEQMRSYRIMESTALVWGWGLFGVYALGFVLVVVLQTQRTRAENALLKSNQLEKTIELLGDASALSNVEIIIMEPPDKIIFSSNNVSSILDSSLETTRAFLREISAGGAMERRQFTRSFADKTGERRIYSWTIVPAAWISKSAIVLVGFDRTALEQQEQALYQRARLTTLGEMLTSLSHEIAQPLTAINFAASSISDQGTSNPGFPKSLELLTSAVNRIKSLVNRMRLFGRLEVPDELEAVDIEICVRHVHELISNDLALANIRLENLVPPDTFVLGNELLIEQVILNVALNARDAIVAIPDTQTDRRLIQVSLAEKTSELVSVEVRDYGIGIPSKIRTRIFDPFFSTKPSGTGLGLALSFGIMRDMNGSIEVLDSDVGSRFVLGFKAGQTNYLLATS